MIALDANDGAQLQFLAVRCSECGVGTGSPCAAVMEGGGSVMKIHEARYVEWTERQDEKLVVERAQLYLERSERAAKRAELPKKAHSPEELLEIERKAQARYEKQQAELKAARERLKRLKPRTSKYKP